MKQNAGQSGLIYDEFPQPLKVQIFQIWDVLAQQVTQVMMERDADIFYAGAVQAVCHELGVFRLTDHPKTARQDLGEYFLNDADASQCLDLIEIVFNRFWEIYRKDHHLNFHLGQDISKAIDRMNARFREHCVGYEYREAGFIRIDSQFLHSEAVEPALELLAESYLEGANHEFTKAQEHYRHGRYGESMNECLKAFESAMKAICDKRGWHYEQKHTVKELLPACEKGGLFPPFMQSSLGGLRSVLTNVATFRNKLSGHGQGVQHVRIDRETAMFVLTCTAANIVYLVSREKLLR